MTHFQKSGKICCGMHVGFESPPVVPGKLAGRGAATESTPRHTEGVLSVPDILGEVQSPLGLL